MRSQAEIEAVLGLYEEIGAGGTVGDPYNADDMCTWTLRWVLGQDDDPPITRERVDATLAMIEENRRFAEEARRIGEPAARLKLIEAQHRAEYRRQHTE